MNKNTVGFYSIDSSVEAERLRLMAELADSISLNAVVNFLGSDMLGRTIVDVGAGDSVSLGKELRSRGAKYVAVDQRQNAIEAHLLAGFEGIHSSATNIEIESDLADVIHSRFTFGWLSLEQRKAALKEMVRIAKPNSEIIIIDYDWSRISGSDFLLDVAAEAVSILEEFGFNPNYGRDLISDFSEKLTPNIKDGKTNLITHPLECAPIIEGRLIDCLPILQHTAHSIFDYLEQTGDYARLSMLQEKLRIIESYSIANPEESSRLADVVVQRLTVEKKGLCTRTSITELNIDSEMFQENIDFERIVTKEKSVLYNSVLAKSQKLIDAARRVQAESYVNAGIVHKEALENGLLPENTDSLELIFRSKYFVTLDDSHLTVKACIRAIFPDLAVGIESLPSAHRNPAVKDYINSSDYPLQDIVELSALSKNFSKGTIIDVIKSVLVMMIFGNEHGVKLAVMELISNNVNMIKFIFGANNFHHIESDSTGKVIDLPGVNQEVRFIDLSVDVTTFFYSVLDNAILTISQADELGKQRPRIAQLIADSLTSYLM